MEHVESQIIPTSCAAPLGAFCWTLAVLLFA